MYIYIYVCGVIISVRRELNLNAYGNGRHARARTPALHHRSERQLECRQGIPGKMSAVPLWQGSCRSTINITGRLNFPEHEDDCMEAYPLRAWLQVLGLMIMSCRLLNIV